MKDSDLPKRVPAPVGWLARLILKAYASASAGASDPRLGALAYAIGESVAQFRDPDAAFVRAIWDEAFNAGRAFERARHDGQEISVPELVLLKNPETPRRDVA